MHILGKVAVITGGSTGLGSNCIRTLLGMGAKVAFGDFNRTASEKFVESLGRQWSKNILFVETDVTKPNQIRNLFQETMQTFGAVDIIIPNAGVAPPSAFTVQENRPDLPDLITLNINLTGVVNTAYIGMDKRFLAKGGVIVFVSSVYGLYPLDAHPLYTASKHGVVGFARAVAPLLAMAGQRCFILGPGYVQTPLVMDGDMGKSGLIEKTMGWVTAEQVQKAMCKGLEDDQANGAFYEILPETTNTIEFRPLPPGLAKLHKAIDSGLSGHNT